MMVGHAALAFAVAAWAAYRLGLDRERALAVGLAAAGFAVVPDVDVGYALVGLATAGTADPWALVEAFWHAGNAVHRGPTHSLVVAGLAAVGFGLSVAGGAHRIAAAGGLAALVIVIGVAEGPLLGGVVGSFVLGGLVVATVAKRAGLPARVVLATALVGVLSHPFGDLFTGEPPPFLYPLGGQVPAERVLLSADPTLHLLGTFGLVLATLWLAAATYCLLDGRALRSHVDPRAVLGAGYAPAIVLLPPPTLEVSYHFVFSVLAVGTVAVVVDPPVPDVRIGRTRATVALTALAAVTVAWSGYAVAYTVT